MVQSRKKSQKQSSSLSHEQKPRTVFSIIMAVVIISFGLLQFLTTVHTYILNVNELNSLKSQEAALIQQKETLDNDIKRWDDKAYVVSQARERLGFVYPGETSVLVLGADKLSDQAAAEEQMKQKAIAGEREELPWYKELQYSFQQADEQKNNTGNTFHTGKS